MMSEMGCSEVDVQKKKILWDHSWVTEISHHACKNTEISIN